MREGAPNKSERLINLTMALLSSRRYLTKSEIFRTVDGYTGSAETMERMFERDKNDLRELGLAIDVGSEDPLFEDEAGYRIDPGEYSLDIGEIDPTELALISLAATRWQSSFFSKSGQSALRKLQSFVGGSNSEPLSLPFYRPEIPSEHFALLYGAIKHRSQAEFTYHGLKDSYRSVAPYALVLNQGFWYLIALDLKKNEIRSFKLLRIDSDLLIDLKPGSFVIPEGLNPSKYFEQKSATGESREVKLLVRIGRSHEIRSISHLSPYNDDWDEALLSITSTTEFFELLSRAMSSAMLLEPEDLRQEFIARMRGKIHV